jgi:hypothetical protein
MAGDLNRTLTAAITRAVGQVMNAYGNDRAGRLLKPLDWSVTSSSGALTGYIPVDCPEGEVAIVVAAWSWAIGLILVPADPNMAGLVTCTGEVEGRQVVIWGVTDRDTWESAPGGGAS